MVLIASDMAPAIDRIAARHAALRIVLDHLGLTQGKFDDEAFRDHAAILEACRGGDAAEAARLVEANFLRLGEQMTDLL